MVQKISVTPVEYENNKALISMYLNGDLTSDQLPQDIKDVLFQWEVEEAEIEAYAESY